MRVGSAAIVLGLTMLAGGVASAQTGGVDAVLACRDVRGDKAQLACFRRAANALAHAPAAAPSETNQAQATAPAAPAPRPFGAPAPHVRRDADSHSVVLRVRSIGDLGDGRAILNFEDGSSWVETEAEPISSAVKPGQAVTLEKGMLGGYFLDLSHRALIHIKRLRTE
jgi:hypothetical protein